MKMQSFILAATTLSLVVGGAFVPAAPAGAQGVTVSLGPSQQVTPGAAFDLYITATQAGSAFNGFDAVIGYDPAALTLVPMTPVSLQEGTYMTGACGNTFHVFHAGVATDTIADVLLCNGVSLAGPGQLYHLRFLAASTTQVTVVRFLPGLQFYNAGLYVNPVTSTNALIGIGVPPPVGVEEPGAHRLSLGAAPNPSAGRLVFTVASDRAGPETLTVLDLQGRVVRRFPTEAGVPGIRTIGWDGRDDAGAPLRPGIYLARLEIAGRTVWHRLTLLH